MVPSPIVVGEQNRRECDLVTYKGFQAAEQLRDALKASRAKEFVFSQTSTDGEVFQPQQLDVWVVGIVTLVNTEKQTRQL